MHEVTAASRIGDSGPQRGAGELSDPHCTIELGLIRIDLGLIWD
eukprot:SAG31_NODE_249_length_19118_cov_47.456195_12_plen_44_part_00